MDDITAPASPQQLLVVEADDGIATPLSRALESHGHVVQRAADGGEALERLRRSRAALVVLDVDLADLDGAQLGRRILDEGLAATVLLLTSGRWTAEEAGFGRTALVDHVIKPFTLGEFLYRANALLRVAGPQVPAPREHRTAGSDEGQVPQNVV